MIQEIPHTIQTLEWYNFWRGRLKTSETCDHKRIVVSDFAETLDGDGRVFSGTVVCESCKAVHTSLPLEKEPFPET